MVNLSLESRRQPRPCRKSNVFQPVVRFTFPKDSEVLDQEKLDADQTLDGWGVTRFLSDPVESPRASALRHRVLRQHRDTTAPAASPVLPKSDSERAGSPRRYSH